LQRIYNGFCIIFAALKSIGMKVYFYLRYHTVFGQSLKIKGNVDELGNNQSPQAVAMEYLNEEFWQCSVELDAAKARDLRYNYILVQPDGSLAEDGERDRRIELPGTGETEVHLVDTWNDEGDYQNVFNTSPFQEVLLSDQENKARSKPAKHFTHIFKVKAPLLKKHEVVCLAGSSQALGNWTKDGAIMMTKEGSWWTAKLSIPRESFPIQYKYGVYSSKDKDSFLESSGDRHLFGNATNPAINILHDGFINLPAKHWKGAGVAIPVFSLKTKNGFGVGEFNDIKLLADWARETGLRLIQILPVNDTSATNTSADSYPYAAISAFALHPIYINLEKVAGKKQADIIKQLKKKQKQLNDLKELDYEQVMKFKISTLKELFQAQKDEYLNDAAFYEFFTSNRHWLVPYAAFCYLRDKNGTSDFSQWKASSVYDKEAIEKFVHPKARHYDDIFFQYYIQYHLHLQLKEAAEYAHKKGVVLKGDIPIGVYRHSCDAWMHPELFNMNKQAGAPPDDFAVKGQNWGFPTYNWQKMQENNFAWWRQRFHQMSHYFDAFRIDHILGFFRIWSIPVHSVEGIMGYFDPAIPVYWKEFMERNIWFNHDRYTKPYITDDVLKEIFSDTATIEQVKQEYLVENGNGSYNLNEDFNTQRKVEGLFRDLEQTNQNNTIKSGLYDLISNVILFEVPGSEGKEFHFRIDMDKISSFRHLDHHTQNQLRALYVNYFYSRQDEYWKKEAMHKLPALKASTNMLICGEDLGMVPHCVPEVMKQLGILSLEIQRMPKDPKKEFFHPHDAPYLSVVTPSTHDMSTIRGWWEEDRDKTRRFFNHELGQWGDAPQTCEPWVNKSVILQHLYSPAMWSIFQLQDLFGMSETLRRENPNDERINVPADPKHYWRYRMHIPLEQLMKERDFNDALKGYLHSSGR
jgi:4-alpha-glucanotransferase